MARLKIKTLQIGAGLLGTTTDRVRGVSKYACIEISSHTLDFLFQFRKEAIRNTTILRSQSLHFNIKMLLILYTTVCFDAKAGVLSKMWELISVLSGSLLLCGLP